MKQDPELVHLTNKLKSALFYPRLKSIFKSTLCFFHNDEKGKIKAAGSGVLISYKENIFIVSAAHVLGDHPITSFLILEDKELQIGGKLFSSRIPANGSRFDDKIDIAVLKVDDYSKEELLKNYIPVPESEIKYKHKPAGTGTYIAVGYPLIRTKKVWDKDEIKSSIYCYQSEIDPAFDYERHGFNNSTNIAIKFDGEVTDTNNPHAHLAPKLIGMSGCGFWHFQNYVQEGKSLIGIVIQQVKEPQNKVVVTTRMDLVKQLMDKALE